MLYFAISILTAIHLLSTNKMKEFCSYTRTQNLHFRFTRSLCRYTCTQESTWRRGGRVLWHTTEVQETNFGLRSVPQKCNRGENDRANPLTVGGKEAKCRGSEGPSKFFGTLNCQFPLCIRGICTHTLV